MGGPIRVLHVDDGPGVAEVVGDFLERTDDRLTVETVTDAERAVTRVETEPIDCVVSDYDMPSVDGIEFLRRVRDHDERLPFVLFTGKGSEAVASEAISAGVTDYLQKGSGTEQYALLANRIVNAVEAERSREALRETKRRLDLALDGTETAVWEWDRSTDAVVLDATLEGILGIEPGAFEGTYEAFERRVHPEDLPDVRAAIDRAVEETGRYEAEFRMFHEDGGVRWVETHARLTDENGERLLGIARDVTERRRRETRRRETVERLTFALEATDSVVWVSHTDESAVARYGPVERLTGLSSDAIDTGEAYLDRAVHPDDRERVERCSNELDAGERESMQLTYRTDPDDGSVRWIEDTAERRLTDGDPHVIGLMTDVTDRERRERELERRNERLEEFTSVVSHDLRNPLSVAAGQLELAATDGERIDRAQEALDRMSELIDELLTLARAGERSVDPEPLSLAETAESCARTVGSDDLAVDAAGATIHADPTGVKQLFENLFANAVDHAAGSDGVTVRVTPTADGFAVADDGPGIPPEERDQVLAGGYSTTEDGVGFGLAIVRRIAEAHGWDVHVTESAAGGARFEFDGVHTENHA